MKKNLAVGISDTINNVRKEMAIKKAEKVYDDMITDKSKGVYKGVQSYLTNRNDLFDGDVLIYQGIGYKDSPFIQKKTCCIMSVVLDMVIMLRQKYSEQYIFAIYRTENNDRIRSLLSDIKEDIRSDSHIATFPIADQMIIEFLVQLAMTLKGWYKASCKNEKYVDIIDFYMETVFALADNYPGTQKMILAKNLDQMITRLDRTIRLLELGAPETVIEGSYGLLYLSILLWTHDSLAKGLMR